MVKYKGPILAGDDGFDHAQEKEFEDSCELQARELNELFFKGLHELKSKPGRYKKFTSENGWGYNNALVQFVENYFYACYEFLNTNVEGSKEDRR